jgi:hypothetical protein
MTRASSSLVLLAGVCLAAGCGEDPPADPDYMIGASAAWTWEPSEPAAVGYRVAVLLKQRPRDDDTCRSTATGCLARHLSRGRSGGMGTALSIPPGKDSADPPYASWHWLGAAPPVPPFYTTTSAELSPDASTISAQVPGMAGLSGRAAIIVTVAP